MVIGKKMEASINGQTQAEFQSSYDVDVYGSKDPEEVNANNFATYLLLPETGLTLQFSLTNSGEARQVVLRGGGDWAQRLAGFGQV